MPDDATASPTIPLAVVLMDEGEARLYVTWINESLTTAGQYLLELYEREGWRALGYGSWISCVAAEFTASRRTLYRHLELATAERDVRLALEAGDTSEPSLCQNDTPQAPKETPMPIPTPQQAKELQELGIQSGYQAVNQVWGEIVSEYGPHASAAYVREKVQARLPQRTAPAPLPSPPRKETRDIIIPHLKASNVDDALVLQGRWDAITRWFAREWAVVPAVELARALPKRDLVAAAERVTHMATWISEFNAIVEERRGRATD